jgi:hypothetical protein
VLLPTDQFIVVNRPEEGAAVSALEPITAGVTFNASVCVAAQTAPARQKDLM